MNRFLVLPILIPLGTAALSMVVWRHRFLQRCLGLTGTILHLGVSTFLLWYVNRHGILAVQMGAWPSPFGITLVMDLFGGIMLFVAALMGFACAVYSLTNIDSEREAFGYYPLYHVLLMGVSGAFLTGDIFNMYVWFEVLLMSSFVLLALGGECAQMEGALKYVTLNLLSSALFLAAVGILYGMVGTVNMADLAVKLREVSHPGLVTTLAVLFLVAFGIKAAIFPLFFWLPASYHTPPVAVSAIFAGLLTKVGVYSLIRVFSLLFTTDTGYTHALITGIAGFTMLVGVLGAAAQNEFRRILSFHIVSQIGYMIMGLGLFTPLALAGSVFYILHHIIVKTNLFLVSGLVHRLRGSFELKKLGGVYASLPWVGVLFLIPALSLAGVPPLSGFFSKLILVRAGLELREYGIVAVALIVSILTLYSMTKIWAEVFWKKDPEPKPAPAARGPLRNLVFPIALLAACTLYLGLAGEPMFAMSKRAGEQLMHPQGYIAAVMGARA